MLRILTLLSFLVITSAYGQTYSGALKIGIEEKIKEVPGKRELVNEKIIIVLNDTTDYSLTSDNEGYVSIKNLEPGKYKVKVVRVDCRAYEIRDILIGENKTAYVTFTLICTSYINSLTKKEKRKLGYK